MVKCMRAICCVALAGLAAPASAAAPQVTAEVRVDSAAYVLGDWITLHVTLTHPPGVTFQSLVADTIGGFSVLRRSPLEAVADTLTSASLVVARYEPGTAVLPPLAFLCVVPGDTAARTVLTNALMLTNRAVAVDTTKAIRDLKAPLTIPLTFADLLPYLGGLVVIAGLAYVWYRHRKRRARPVIGPASAPLPRPAHVMALEELAALKEKRLWQQGHVKQYYSEATEILRRYIEHRFRMMALEETTEEIMDNLRTLHLPPEVLQTAEAMLRRADLVKFAKHQPGTGEHEETMTVAVAFVNTTRPTPTPVPTIARKEVAAHAGN